MATPAEPLTEADRELLGRIASRVVEWRMEVPAILTLETCRPVSLLAGQAMTFFEPMVQAVLRLPDYRAFSRLVERRDALEALTAMIEAEAQRVRTKPPAASAGSAPRSR